MLCRGLRSTSTVSHISLIKHKDRVREGKIRRWRVGRGVVWREFHFEVFGTLTDLYFTFLL